MIAMAKMKKADAIKRIHRLFSSGEKLNAIRMADEFKLKDDEKPEGMESHREGLRREHQ